MRCVRFEVSDLQMFALRALVVFDVHTGNTLRAVRCRRIENVRVACVDRVQCSLRQNRVMRATHKRPRWSRSTCIQTMRCMRYGADDPQMFALPALAVSNIHPDNTGNAQMSALRPLAVFNVHPCNAVHSVRCGQFTTFRVACANCVHHEYGHCGACVSMWSIRKCPRCVR